MNRQKKLRQMADQIEKGFGLQKGAVIPTTRQRAEAKRAKPEPKPYSDLDHSYWGHQIR